jgi:hypothetical protein
MTTQKKRTSRIPITHKATTRMTRKSRIPRTVGSTTQRVRSSKNPWAVRTTTKKSKLHEPIDLITQRLHDIISPTKCRSSKISRDENSSEKISNNSFSTTPQ